MQIRIHKRIRVVFALVGLIMPGVAGLDAHAGNTPGTGRAEMIDLDETQAQLRQHLKTLTVDIGERSVRIPGNLKKAANYIHEFYKGIGLDTRLEPYSYHGFEIANVVAELRWGRNAAKRILIGAHYDCVAGTVGADDNASAVAVQLETARQLALRRGQDGRDLAVAFVSFALEEPPVFGTEFMGSRVYAKQARRRNEPIDAMLCLEMVGYACDEPGCQAYPFPLMFFGYPREGNFVGIVGNFASRRLARRIHASFRNPPGLPAIQLTVPFNGWIMPAVRLSDHASFWDEGFPAVMITDSAFYRNPHYHLPSDRMDTLDERFMAVLVKSLVTFLIQER